MATPSTAPSLKQAAVGDLLSELATTRRLLERVPDEHLAWKPHEKSFSLGELSAHLANLLFWQLTAMKEEGFDVGSTARVPGAQSREALLRQWDEGVEAVKAAMEQLDEASLADEWTLRKGDHVIFRMPRLGVIRGMGINHLVHHRGQLSVYLRLLEVPLPPMYGPTADEAF